jgi:hypothetical protein
MYINPNWRILTIGDGDLSFSASLMKNYQPRTLTATILDELSTLVTKYGDDNHYQALVMAGCQVITGFDVTEETSWKNLVLNQFDLVIFQFPLIPAFTSEQEFSNQCNNVSINTLNRRLLRKYLQHSFRYFLDEAGEQLAYISSKEVKPYSQWNIETSLVMRTDLAYLGKAKFDIDDFPGYKIRNVDRDKHVKDTLGFTYIYTNNDIAEAKESQLEQHFASSVDNKLLLKDKNVKVLSNDEQQSHHLCHVCHTGIFTNEADKQFHFSSKKHQQMARYDKQWRDYLASC